MPQHLLSGPPACLALVLILGLASCGAAPKSRWGVRGQVPLNLEPLFDNDAIAGPQNRDDGNFDCPDHPADLPGSTFPAENLPASGTKFMLDGVWYLFPSKEPGDVNNVACNGQRIAVPPGRYRALHVVGASENGSFRAPLKLIYEEGPDEAELALTDWCQDSQFGESVAFEASHRYTYSELWGRVVQDKAKPHLFVQTIALDPEQTLKSIGLPYKRRMHLFAATLDAATWQQEQVDYANEAAELYESLPRRKPQAAALVRRKLDSLIERLDALAAEEGPFARQYGWLRVQTDHVRHRLGKSVIGDHHISPGRLRTLSRKVRRIGADLQTLEGGHDPFPAKRGNFLRGHRSPLDGSLQSYSLSVPGDYTGEEPFPLMVSLHGHGWYRPFQGHPQPVIDGIIMVGPHGRGSQDYMLAAERDVLAVIEDVLRDYNIDRRQIILEGHSMGGTGSWHIGVHHPGRFACVAPVCGNADRRAWDAWKPTLRRKREPHPVPPQFERLRTHILDSLDPITYAGNLLHVPALVAHGAEDDVVPVEHSRNMADRLRTLGCEVQYFEFPFLRHWGFSQDFYDKRWTWMLEQRRAADPDRVRFKTARLRNNEAYWVRIDRLRRPLAFAEIDARRQDDGSVEVATENVTAFTLDLQQAGRITIDGQAVEANKPRPTLVRSEDDRWAAGELPAGPAKKKGLEGPVGDVFLGSFLLVRGTTSDDPWKQQVIQRDRRAAMEETKQHRTARQAVEADEVAADASLQIGSSSLHPLAHADHHQLGPFQIAR
jgi:predicted esterase